MSEFLTILSLYYICDATAALRPMTRDEIASCTRTYETVKTHFVTERDLAPRGTAERIAQMQAAYLAFQDWEAENADLVREMQDDAMAEVRGLAPTRI